MIELLSGILIFGTNILFVALYMFILIIFFFMVGQIARAKNRSSLFWIIAAAFFPLITVIILLILTRKYPRMDNDFAGIPQLGDKNPTVVSVIGIAGYIAQADGKVESEQYDFIYRYLKKNYNVSKKDLAGYKDIIDYTKLNPSMIDKYVEVINKYTKDNKRNYNNLQLSFLLTTLVTINNDIRKEEVEALKKVMLGLKVSPAALDPMLKELLNQGVQQKTINDLLNSL